MALDWLPIAPSRVPHRRAQAASAWFVSRIPFAAAVYPVVDVLATRRFLPVFPAQVPHHRAIAPYRLAAPAVFTAATWPTSWLPRYPDRMPHRRTSPVIMPSHVQPSPSLGALVAAGQGWAPRFPPWIAGRRPAVAGGGTWTVPPTVVATAVGCGVQLAIDALTVTGLTAEALTASGATAGTGTSTTLTAEEVC